MPDRVRHDDIEAKGDFSKLSNIQGAMGYGGGQNSSSCDGVGFSFYSVFEILIISSALKEVLIPVGVL